jgi:predicted dehydrogenase
MNDKPVTIAILGAGSRGLLSYAPFALQYPDKAKIVAVAEPREWFREQAREQHLIPAENVFSDWRELLKQPRLADAVIVATQDVDHAAPAITAAKQGYAILLEKPMATKEADCRAIVAAVKESAVPLAVCHVLRYTPYFKKIKEIIDSNVLGQITTVRHFEKVQFWHHAHSYVRGNWRNEATSSPMILAKSCHDLDILLFLLGEKCKALSSFGHLSHFKAANAPEGAAENCLDCEVASCPYSAKDFYLGRLQRGLTGWPLNVITQDFTEEGVTKVLREGPYGRCVYRADNDVVDHQVVNFEFESGVSASFTMAACTADGGRETEVFGSHGQLKGNGAEIFVTDFRSGKTETVHFKDSEDGVASGHYGGDFAIMHDFIAAVRGGVETGSGAEVSLESHLLAFAAEKSRKLGTVERAPF